MQTCFSCRLLTFSCCFWGGDLVVSEAWNMNKSDESCLFSFFEIAQSLITFLIAGNLTECVQVQLTWKLSRFFDTWREAQVSSPIPVVPSLKKKKKERKEKKTVHSTNEDWSWKISPSLCWTFTNWFALYFNFLSLIVTYSSQFTWQGHRKLQWAMSKDEPLLSNCQLETAEPSRNYARVPGYKKKIQEKDKKKTRKEKKNERRRNQYARVRRYKITSTLGLLVRGDPQNEGLRGLQPRALGSKLDYFHAGITSTRLHRH